MVEHGRRNARAGVRSRSTDEAQRLLDVDILPVIGQHRAEAVTKRMVMEAVEKVAQRGALVTADHVLGLIRATYNYANGTGALEVNPTLGLKRRNASRPRERVLTDEEIRILWQALDDAPKLSMAIRDALKLELLLGVRISEARGAAKSEIDLVRRVWTIPSVRTKAEREHKLPLSDIALEIVRGAMERAGRSQWLFPANRQDRSVRSKSAQRALLRLRAGIGLNSVGTHDLRRTLATGLGNLGIADETIERVLNHAPRTVTNRHYNHAKNFEPMRIALETWAARIRGIVEGRPPKTNVVALPFAGAPQ